MTVCECNEIRAYRHDAYAKYYARDDAYTCWERNLREHTPCNACAAWRALEHLIWIHQPGRCSTPSKTCSVWDHGASLLHPIGKARLCPVQPHFHKSIQQYCRIFSGPIKALQSILFVLSPISTGPLYRSLCLSHKTKLFQNN